MSETNLTKIAIPAAGAVLGLFLFGYVVRDFMTVEKTPPCSGRYPSATEFNLKSASGAPLSPGELQARAGAEEWGVLDNAEVAPAKEAPSPLVLKVRLPEGSSSKYQENGKKGGVSFRWTPNGMEGATAACLRYSVYVPAGFDFGTGGELPGVFGGAAYQPGIRADGTNGLATRIKWAAEGQGELSLQAPNGVATGLAYSLGQGSFKLPRERWLAIEQEVVLNAEGINDGIARVWIDGDLRIEHLDVPWRTSKTLAISGIAFDVWYGGLDNVAAAPGDSYLALSPATVSWK